LNDGTNQKKLLVARNKKQCEELSSRMFQMSTEQDATYEKGRRITSFRNTRRTLAGNQHQYNWAITKVK